jgi:hypothetical protein
MCRLNRFSFICIGDIWTLYEAMSNFRFHQKFIVWKNLDINKYGIYEDLQFLFQVFSYAKYLMKYEEQ